MERFNFDYSQKNIPIPSKHEYKVQLISNAENVVKRMRWKALEFLGRLGDSQKQTYRFHSRKCPPVVDETSSFENDLMKMIKDVEFRNVKK